MATNIKKIEDRQPQSEPANIMAAICSAAANPDVDPEKMERLMALYERMEAKKAEIEFNAALAAVQDELPEITERGQIKHGSQIISTYALWEDVNAAIKPVLKAHGFALSFRTDTTGGQITVTAVLSHKGGHSQSTSLSLPSDTGGAKNAVQAVASSVSYGKRYTAGALLNLTTRGEDDDGQKAGGPQPITDDQAVTIQALAEEVNADIQKFLQYLAKRGKTRITTIEEIPASMYRDAVAALEAKRAR